MEVDDGGRWNIVGDTSKRKNWPRFTIKHLENLSMYIFRTIKENRDIIDNHNCLTSQKANISFCSPNDVLITHNILSFMLLSTMFHLSTSIHH